MANGHGGRRPGAGGPKGVRWQTTLAKEAAREELRRLLTPYMQSIVEAQVKSALGLKYLVTRDPKNGKFTKVTEAMARNLSKKGVEIIEVWEKDPSTPAFTTLADRYFDKPAEQKQKIELEGDWDKLAARLASARHRGEDK